jgi:opacity protein-like surface antigen
MNFYTKRRFFALIAVLALMLCRSAKAEDPIDVTVPNDATVVTDAAITSDSATVSDAASAPDPAALGEAASASAPQTSPTTPDGGWHFGITPYIWFAGSHGTVGFRGVNSSYHASFGDIISNLNLGVMVAAEARKGRFVVPVDYLWMKLSDDKALPVNEAGVTSVKVKVTESILTPKVGYALINQEKLKVDALVGIRYWHLGEDLTLIPTTVNRSESANWVDVVAGARLQAPLSPKAMVTIFGDAGAGGANVDYQVGGLLGYKFKPNIIGQLGYRYLDVNYRSTSTFIFDAATSGIVLGVTFNLK